jgi:hypothetical protein
MSKHAPGIDGKVFIDAACARADVIVNPAKRSLMVEGESECGQCGNRRFLYELIPARRGIRKTWVKSNRSLVYGSGKHFFLDCDVLCLCYECFHILTPCSVCSLLYRDCGDKTWINPYTASTFYKDNYRPTDWGDLICHSCGERRSGGVR